MNHEHIRSCLEEAGYDAELTADASALNLKFDAGERRITLVHAFPNDLLRTPMFHLASGYNGKLAHVGVEHNGEPGEVCIGDPESTAVNTDRPERVYLDTVQNHVKMLTRLIEDPEFNRTEQLREFHAHWEILCRSAAGELDDLFVGWDGHEVESLQVKAPRATSGTHLGRTHLALANGQQLPSVCGIAEWGSRQVVGKALGVPLSAVEPERPPAVRNCCHGTSVRSAGRTLRGVTTANGCTRQGAVTTGWSSRPRFPRGTRCSRSAGIPPRRVLCHRRSHRHSGDSGP